MSHTVAVVAHLDRLTAAERLVEQIGAAYVHYDDGSLGCNESHHRTWMWHRDNTTTEWSVVLEDDAVPVNEFAEQLDMALDVAPASIASLYLGRLRPPRWQTRIQSAIANAVVADAHWVVGTHLLHAVGVAIRTDLLTAMRSHAGHQLPADERITAWARHSGLPIAYTWPSLVDHADGPTLVLHRDGKPRTCGRVAWQTGTRGAWNSERVSL